MLKVGRYHLREWNTKESFIQIRGVPFGTTLHETNHFADFLKNQSPYADEGSNLYKWMRSAIKPYSDKKTKYFAKPTEQKAYMN